MCSHAKLSQASERRHGRKFPFDESASCHPRTRVVHRNACVGSRFRVVEAPLDLRFALVWGDFRHKVRHSEWLCHQSTAVCAVSRDRGGGASLSVRDDTAIRRWRRAPSEPGGGTVLARPETQLSGRARGVVLVANDEAKRRSRSLPRHLPMNSLNLTSRVRPVRSPGDFGRDKQRGCWSILSW